VVGRGWVTVSGPPSTLKLLIVEFSEHKDLSLIPLPVASAVHAPHLRKIEYDSVVKPSYIWEMELQEGACIMSTDKCIPYSANTLDEVARQIIRSTLYAPLMIKGTFDATAEYLKGACVTAAISVLGPSAQATSLIQTLKHAGIHVDVLSSPVCKLNPSVRSGSGAVAVVGMSARLPQANDLEEFWKILMEGRTTHGRVIH
jgi:naphtho-gamma-pyrone polyketide synthase